MKKVVARRGSQVEQSIDDILNATDSSDDDDPIRTDGVDLEMLLEDDDDLGDLGIAYSGQMAPDVAKVSSEEIFQNDYHLKMPSIGPSIDSKPAEGKQDCDPNHLDIKHASLDDAVGEGDDGLNDEDDEDENDLSPTNEQLSGLWLADRREQRTLSAGVRDVVSALQSKRNKTANTKHGHSLTSMQSNLKCVDMEALSSQLKRNSSYKQHGPGVATIIKVHSKFIAVGTSKGLVLLFDHAEEIRLVIGSSVMYNAGARCMAPVTALDVSISGLMLICGHETGEIALWDVLKGSSLKRLHDLHQHCIVRLNFINSINTIPSTAEKGDMVAISVDTKGIVHRVRFSKSMWSSFSTDSDCLLDGNAGAILDMNTLPPLADATDAEVTSRMSHLPQQTQLVALNSKTRSYIVQVAPQIRITFRWPAPNIAKDPVTGGTIPFVSASLDWSWSQQNALSSKGESGVGRATSAFNTYCPVLARAWGETIQILALFPAQKDDNVNYDVVGERTMPGYNFLCVKWLTHGSTIALLCFSEVLIVRHRLETLEKVTLAPALSISLRALFDGRDFADQALRSIASVSNQHLYVLSPDSLYSFHIQSWVEQVHQLIREGKWLEALAVSLENWTARDKSDPNGQTSRDQQQVDRFIKKYVDLAISQPPPAANTLLATKSNRNHYHLVAGVCIEYCVTSDRETLLFGDLFQAFVSVGQESVFLESLESYILCRAVKQLPEHMLTALVDVSIKSQRSFSLERCAIFLNLEGCNIEPLLALFQERRMFSGYLYVQAFAGGDFRSAFLTVFGHLIEAGPTLGADFPTPEQANIGYKLQLFICYVGESRAFPRGDTVLISTRALVPLVEELFSAENIEFAGKPFPYLSLLCRIDSCALIHSASTILKLLHHSAKISEEDDLGLKSFTCIADIYSTFFRFVSLMDEVSLSTDNTKSFFESCLLELVECLGPLSVELIDAVTKYCSSEVIPRLAAEDYVSQIVQKQSKHPQVVSALRESLLKHNFWLASLGLQNRKQFPVTPPEFESGIKAYLAIKPTKRPDGKAKETKDAEGQGDDRMLVFKFIEAMFQTLFADGVSGSVVSEFCASTSLFLPELAVFSLEKTQSFVCTYLSSSCTDIITNTKKQPSVQFALLNVLITTVTNDTSKEISEYFTQQEILTYIRLLLIFKPLDVFAFVTFVDHYPLDECLALCKEKEVYDATAFLMERAGDASAALDLLHVDLTRSIQIAKRDVEHQLRTDTVTARSVHSSALSSAESNRSVVSQILSKQGAARADAASRLPCFKGLQHIVSCAAGLCMRHSSKSNTLMWFSTFDHLLKEKQHMRHGSMSSSAEVVVVLIGLLVQYFMAQMKSMVPPQDIIRRVAQQQGQATGSRFAEFKDVMISMVETYANDLFLSEILLKMHISDLQKLNAQKYMRTRRADRMDTNEDNGVVETKSSNEAMEVTGETDVRSRKENVLAVRRSNRGYVHARDHRVHRLRATLQSEDSRIGGREYEVPLLTNPPPTLATPDLSEDSVRRPGSLPHAPRFKAEFFL